MLPGVEGYFGVKANHVPIIAQLKPGLVELHSSTDVQKFFVSGGFAFVHPNSVTDICAVEAAPLDQVNKGCLPQPLVTSGGGGPGVLGGWFVPLTPTMSQVPPPRCPWTRCMRVFGCVWVPRHPAS